MTFANPKWAPALCAVFALSFVHTIALAQPPLEAPPPKPAATATAKSSPAAVRQFRDAVAFQDRGVYDLAADEWQKLLERFPDDPLAPKARHYLGVCQLLEKKYELAAANFEQVLKEHPDSDLSDASYLNLALAQYSLGQGGKPDYFDRAAATLQTLIDKFPKSKELPEALYYRGEALYARGQKEAAAKAYQQLVDQYADSPRGAEALYALGVTRQELGQSKPAAAAFDKFLKAFPDHKLRSEVILRRAETFFTGGDYVAAEKWFASAADSKNFTHADLAAMRQAASLVAQDKFADAAALYASIPQRFPESSQQPAALLAAGNNYHQAANWDAAAKAYAAVSDGKDALAFEASHGLARTQLKQRQPAEALKTLDRALPAAKGSEQEPQLLLDRADVLYELPDRRAEAVAAYASLAEQFPEHALAPQAMYMAAFAALGQQDYPAAVQVGQEFLKRYANNPLAADVRYIVAEGQLQQQQYAEAAAAFQALIAQFPNHADASSWAVRRALALYLAGQFAEVVSSLDPIAKSLKPAALAAEGNYLLGSAQSELGHHDQAIEALNASLAAEPHGTRADEALLAVAGAYQQVGKLQEGAAALRKLVETVPSSARLPRAYFLLGEYAAQSGDFRSASDNYQHLLSTWPDHELTSYALFGLAGAQLNLQGYPAAEATLTRLLTAFPDDHAKLQSRYARALARERQQNYAGALEDLAALLKADPPATQRLDALYLQGLCHVAQQAWEPAVADFRAILASDTKFAAGDKALYELAWALKSSGNDAESLAAFGRLASEYPQSSLAAESHYHQGEAAYAAQDYAAAAAHYQAARAGTDSADLGEKASHKRAWALYQQRELAQAAEGFRKQLADYPAGELAADARFMIGESLFAQNEFAAAVEAYEQSIAQPAANPNFQALAYLHAAQALAQQKQWEQSLKLLDQAIGRFEQSPYLPEMQYEAGWALQNLGKPDDAMARHEKVVAQTDREVSARARFMIGEILFEKREFKEAIRNFFKVAYGYGYPNAPAELQTWQANASYEAARCFEVLKMTDQARKSYQEVVDKYPQSDKVPLAKNRLEALGS